MNVVRTRLSDLQRVLSADLLITALNANSASVVVHLDRAIICLRYGNVVVCHLKGLISSNVRVASIVVSVNVTTIRTSNVTRVDLNEVSVRRSLTLDLIRLVRLDLTSNALPMDRHVLVVRQRVVNRVASNYLRVTRCTVDSNAARRCHLLLLGVLHRARFYQGLVSRERSLREAILVRLLLKACGVGLILRLLIRHLRVLIRDLCPARVLDIERMERLRRQRVNDLCLTILSSSAVLTLMIVLVLQLVVRRGKDRLI